MQITGNTVFIPGATSGIGLALAVSLSERGNTVIVGGRRSELLARIREQHPGLDTVQVDTTNKQSIAAAAESVLAAHPDLNMLIAMAGIMRTEDWHAPATFVETAEATVETNLLGPIRLIGAFIEHLQSRPDAVIMTVSSGLAFVPLRVTPTYNATKAAIHQLSESIRLQLADTSVQVVELVPPAVRTSLMPGQETSPIAMPLDEFVAEVVQLIEQNPDARELQVQRVGFLRHAESRGDYDTVVATLNAQDPHARHAGADAA
ncbi:SDR family oxidoreductase [Humibacter ginsenosidimutans]|uniref:SDR family NAD(P)-dependent oxidoreductase n=1 Tax=Humibacter ginsenosidimutans TaxID=2599293 RepID=A0A5B8M7Q9_9MICO|nr:SDR family NAD(P)-dependent oxidoreductase [Humibacter ginsenosidimutans]QDZ16748.1 SDR family NAD(P)-dependent oxidoreductase [Humibacter ginsenosidimutans]